MTPDQSLHLAKLADAHCVVSKNCDADFLAVAWYRLAPLPSGRWAVQYGAWCQGVGTADFPWGECRDAAEGTAWFVAAAKDLCHREVEGGVVKVQEKARRRLWAKIDRDHPTARADAAPESTLSGTLPSVPQGVVVFAWEHRRELLALARRVTGDRHLAEDAVQDALLGVHKYGNSKDPDRPFLPWLRTVVLNAARTRV